jgi:hypothetical protein
MKYTKRSYRRYKTWVKFKKRIDLQIAIRTCYVTANDDRQNILEGKSHLRLRTQGRPCNCSMCTPDRFYDKFNRDQKQYWLKDAQEQILACGATE